MSNKRKKLEVNLNRCIKKRDDFDFTLVSDGEIYMDVEVKEIIDKYPSLCNETITLSNEIYYLKEHPFRNLFNFFVIKIKKIFKK